MRRRRMEFLNDSLTSWLNVVPSVQFNPPSYAGGNGNLNDVCYLEMNGYKIYLFLALNTQDVLIRSWNEVNGGVYQGVIRASNNLNNNGVLGNVSFTHSSVTRTAQSIQYVNVGGIDYLYVMSLDGIMARFTFTLDLSIPTASVTFVDSFSLSASLSGEAGTYWFSEDGTKIWIINNGGVQTREFTLSTPFIPSTATLTANETNFRFASRPYFYGNGRYCVGLYRNNDLGTSTTFWDLALYECPIIYSPIGAVLRYRRPMSRNLTQSKLRTHQYLPLFLSDDRKEINWFAAQTTSSNANGRIGVGTFNIPLNFRGESPTLQSGVRGVRFTDGTYVEPN